MVFRTTSTRKPLGAFTAVELLVSTALGLIVLTAFMLVLWFSNRTFASLANYLDLDLKTQVALDKMSRDIREVSKITACSSTNLTFTDYDGGTLQFIYNSSAQTLTRVKNTTNVTTLLTGCNALQFSVFQRTPDTNNFQPVSTTVVTNTKVIELTWNCSRTILGSTANTESMQSAKIVMRNK